MPDQPKSRGWGFTSMEKEDELILGQKDTKYDRSLILKSQNLKNGHIIREENSRVGTTARTETWKTMLLKGHNEAKCGHSH